MKLGQLIAFLFLVMLPTTVLGASKKNKKKASAQATAQIGRSASCVNISMGTSNEQGDNFYALDINSTNGSPISSPSGTPTAAGKRLAIRVSNPNGAALASAPKPNWWQRNRVNVAVGLQLTTIAVALCSTYYLGMKMEGAVAAVTTQMQPIATVSNDILALVHDIENITRTGKP